MARRTKKQKVQANIRKQSDGSFSPTYSFGESQSTQATQLPAAAIAKTKTPDADPAGLFGYDVALIYKDLLKTLLITLVVLSILGVIAKY